MKFQNLSISIKLLIPLAILGAVSIGGALFANNQMSIAQGKLEYIITGPQVASLRIARSFRFSLRAAMAIYENVTTNSLAASRAARERMDQEIKLANQSLEEAASLAPTFAGEINQMRNDLNTALKVTCAETLELADAAETIEQSAAAAASMGKGCAKRLDEVTAAATTLNGRLVAYTDELRAETAADIRSMNIFSIISSTVATLVVLLLALLVVRSGVVAPMRGMIAVMAGLGRGELATPVAGADRRDEVGDLAKGLELLRTQLLDAEETRHAAAAREVADRERLERRETLAQTFVASMQNLASGFARSSGEVAGSARSLSATAEETSRQAQAVAAAAEQAASNVQTVAASSEELAASVREISGRVFHSAEVADVAYREAQSSNQRIAELAKAASAIGDVVSLIKGIADQTNLLALNATIESARAGEAGRGFAVVASEVKELASQTARATDDIAAKVAEIQHATDGTVASMSEIIRVVGDIKSISTTIAGAVEEQGAATGEIAQNCQQAATGTQQVTENISGVGRAAEMTGSASSQLLQLSEGLSQQAGDLRQEVESFVIELQAA